MAYIFVRIRIDPFKVKTCCEWETSEQTGCIITLYPCRSMAEILSERESISKVMQDSLDEATDPWGVKAERVEM